MKHIEIVTRGGDRVKAISWSSAPLTVALPQARQALRMVVVKGFGELTDAPADRAGRDDVAQVPGKSSRAAI